MYNVAFVEPNFIAYLKGRGVSSHSIRNYLSDVRHFFGWLARDDRYKTYPSNFSLNTLTSLTLQEYAQYHLLNSLPLTTINRRLSALRNFLEFSKKTGAINDETALHVKNVAINDNTSHKTDTTKPLTNHHVYPSLAGLQPIGLSKQLREVYTRTNSFASGITAKYTVKTGLNNLITNGKYNLKLVVIFIFIVFLFTIALILRKPSEILTVSKTQPSPLGNRYISFSGKLTDSLGNPIDTKSDIVFRLYSNPKDGKILYTASCIGQNYAITPDVNGNFRTLLGKDCGAVGLPSSIFIENPEIYVGLSVNSDTEMSPRQPIANVGFAANSNTIQGLTLGTSTSAVPFIDQTGTLLISAPSPLLKATSGKFSITAEALTLSTAVGSSGNIELDPDIGGNTLISSGSLGIGVGLPSSSLDIAGSASLSGNLSFRGIFSQINQLEGGTISFQTSKGGDRELTPRMTILNGGNIGIGTSLPKWKFHVSDTKPLDGIVSIENTSINNTSSPTGLLIKMGKDGSNANPGGNDTYISFVRGDSGVVGKIQGNGTGGITYSTTGSDFAEYFKSDERSDLNEGDVVKIVAETGTVDKSVKPNDSQLIGVVSSHPGFAGGEPGSNKILVGLIGQVPVKISNLSKNIKAGDFLTSASEPGKAMKAEQKGITLGKALENWDPSQSKDKILVFVNISWYDPTYTYSGKFEEVQEGVFSRLIENLSALTATIHNLTSNFITVREKIVSPVIETEQISTAEIKSTNKNITVILGNEVTPESQDDPGQARMTNADKGPLARLIIKGLDGKIAASIDASGNASFSGALAAESLKISTDASISGRLIAKEIESDNINSLQARTSAVEERSGKTAEVNEGLANNINDIQKRLAEIKNQPLPNVSYYQRIDENQPLTINDLTVREKSNIYNLSVTGTSTIGSLLIENNSILSLAWDLKLSALSTITFFEDAVVISRDGTITTKGKFIAEGGIKTTEIKSLNETDPVSIKQLAVDNLIITNKFNPSLSSLIASEDNFAKNGIRSPAIETEMQAAGSGFIPGGSPEVIIYNNTIKEDSLIYLTPVNSSPSANLTIVKKEASTSKPYFKVGLDTLAEIPVHFNWLIIN